jgi:hypothetical protein
MTLAMFFFSFYNLNFSDIPPTTTCSPDQNSSDPYSSASSPCSTHKTSPHPPRFVHRYTTSLHRAHPGNHPSWNPTRGALCYGTADDVADDAAPRASARARDSQDSANTDWSNDTAADVPRTETDSLCLLALFVCLYCCSVLSVIVVIAVSFL